MSYASTAVNGVKQATTTTAYANAVKNLSLNQAELALSTKNLSVEQQREILVTAGLIEKTGTLTVAQATAALTTDTRNAADVEALMLKAGLITELGAETTATITVDAAKLKELVDTKVLTQAEAELLATKAGVTLQSTKEASTLIASNAKLGSSFAIMGKTAGAALKRIGAGLLSFASAHPLIAALVGVVGTVGLVTTATKKLREEQEQAIETARSLQEEYRSSTKSLSDNISSLESQKDEFERLSKGVDDYGKNISLSSDEYDRYKSIVAKILGYSPELIQGYDAEGNAIANKNSLIERSIELMKEEHRQKLKEMTTDEKTKTAYEGAKADWEQTKGYEGANTRNDIAFWFDNNATSGGWNYEIGIAEILGIKDEWKEEGNNLQNAIINNIETVAKNIKEKKTELLSLEDANGKALFTEAEIDAMIEKANTWKRQYDDWQQDIEDAKHGMDAQFELYSQKADGYNDLTDSQKAFVNEYIKATGDIIDADGNLLSEDEIIKKAEGYTKFVEKLATDPNFEEARTKINTLFSLDKSKMSASEYEKQVNAILKELQDTFKLTDDEVKDFKIALGFTFTSDGKTQTGELLDQVKGKLKDEFDDKTDELTLEELQIAAKIVADIPEGTLLSWDELIAKIEEVKNASLDKSDISSITDMISSINKLSEGFEELDKIYADIKDKGSFDFKLLDDDNFKKNFSGLESYSDFIESVTSSPNDIKKCQSAFNALVTEWIDDTGVLDNLTEANGDLTVSMLEQMGVSNAQEIVHQKLKAAQLNAKIATEATTDEVLRQVGTWINDGEAIGYTKIALFDLISTERIFNNSNLNVARKIAQLEQLAISFGITADAAGTAGLKMSMLNEIKIAKRDGASKEDIKKIEESYLNYAQSQYQKTFEGRFGKLKTFNYSGSTKSNKTSSIKKQVAEIFDWIEVRMSRLKRNIKNLSDTVSNTFKSWSTRRKSLKKEISEISKALSAQKSASSKYLKKANSVDLSESYKKKVREGKIDIESIKDEKLKEKIKKYQEYYQAYLNSKDAEKELEKQLSEAYREQFDLIESEYEGKISLIESNITALENAISLAEAKGKQVGGSYYDDIIAAERERIAALGNEYQALQAQLDAMVASGQIVKYSEEWYAMQNEINQVKQSWDEANISLEQYLQNQREADWSIFDSNQEKIGDVASDNSFLLGLLEDEDMYDENGNITDFGNAANGLRLANMDLYTQQLENYTDELARLEEEYDDKSNTYYLERKRELIEAQQEAINAIKDERQALIDLAKEGYDALLDHMQKIIDKRKEAFNEIKDLRDYEKSIKEQTDEIDVIQKQLIAYQGDDSEESRSTIQKLQQSLKEAQDNLEETQYDKYIKDQEQMYDKLMEDTQNWVDELFENESALLQGIIDNATANSDRIISIVKQIAEQAGYTIQDEQSTELTDVLQREGYARGSKNIPYKQNNWIHAGELLYRTTDGGLLMPLNSGDKVFTSAMAENLWDMAQMNLHPVVPNYDVSPLVNKVIGSNTWSGDVVFNVEMYGVNDPQEFARQIKLVYSNNTGNVRNMIQTDVFSGDMLAHKKYL